MADTMDNARRTASPMSMLRAAAGMSGARPADATTPANEPSPASAPARAEPTMISSNAEIKGTITTADAVEIRGKIEGDVRAASITVCAGGKVKGDLTAETITVQGDVEGRLQGHDVRLQAGANVMGEIAHGSLGIDTAANFEGSIKRIASKAAE